MGARSTTRSRRATAPSNAASSRGAAAALRMSPLPTVSMQRPPREATPLETTVRPLSALLRGAQVRPNRRIRSGPSTPTLRERRRLSRRLALTSLVLTGATDAATRPRSLLSRQLRRHLSHRRPACSRCFPRWRMIDSRQQPSPCPGPEWGACSLRHRRLRACPCCRRLLTAPCRWRSRRASTASACRRSWQC